MNKELERIANLEIAKCLKGLKDKGYKYITRSASGQLKAFRREPKKEINFWCCSSYVGDIEIILDMGMLESIRWEDKQATSLRNVFDKLKVKYNIDEKEM